MEGYFELFKRHWNDSSVEFTVLGFDAPEVDFPPNFRFHSLGKQSECPIWSEPLIEYFNAADLDYFFLSFEDHYLIDDLNREVLAEGIGYMENDGIDKLFISGNDYSHQIRCHYKGTWFLSNDFPNVLTTTSMLPSVWKKGFFLKLLRQKKNLFHRLFRRNSIRTCHDFETVNNKYTLDCRTLMVMDYVVYPNLDCARRGKFNTTIFEYYKERKVLGDKPWMKSTADMDVFEAIYEKWKEKNV